MPSDIYARTSSGWSGAVKKIYAKTGASWSSAARFVYAYINSGWTRVWPLSGIYSTTSPFVSRTTSSSELDYGTVLRVGSTVRGNRGVWNPNGYTISSYEYKWRAYTNETGLGTQYDSGLSTLSGTTNDKLIDGTSFDRGWLTFFVRAKASGGSAYDGSDESLRYYVVRQRPRISIGTTPSFNNNSPKVDDVISYSSSWDTSDAYLPEASRTTIKWYRNSSATTTGGIEIQSSGYSYTVKEADISNYIYAVETTFNSGSDYDLGTTTGVSASAITSSPAQSGLLAPGPLTVTTSSTTSSWSLNITFGTNTTRAEIEYGSSTSYGFSGSISSSGTFTPVGPFPSDTLYYYRVTPYNVSKAGTPVTGSIRTKVLVTKPGPATSVVATQTAGRPYNNAEITVTWSAPLNDGNSPIDYYRIEYAYANNDGNYAGVTWNILADQWTATSITSSPYVANYGGYFVRWKVWSHNAAGYTETSALSNEILTSTKAEKPVINNAVKASNTSITVSFDPLYDYGGTKGDGGSVTTYRLYAIYQDVIFSKLITTSPNTITGLTAGYEYQVFIRASNNEGTVDSDSVYVSLINPPAILAGITPDITPKSGTAGVTQYSVSNGAWSGSPTGYTYLWRYRETSTIYPAAPGVNNQSTYTPPANFVSLYGNTLRCTVTATNAGGSTPANSGDVTVLAPVSIPTNSSAPTLTGTAQVGQTVTFGVGSWNNSPTSYSLRLYRGTAGVITSETLVKDAGNVTSSTYVIPAADSGYYLRAFATATNSAGTSNSGTYTPGTEIGPITVAQSGPTGGSVSVNPTSGTAGSTTYTASISGWSGNPATFSATYSWQYMNTSFSWVQFATGSTAVPPSNVTAYAWQVVATVSNGVSPNGSASSSFSVSAPVVVTKLGTPSGVTASDNRSDGINISWNAVSGANYYGVWWGGAPGYDNNPDFANITGTSYLDTGAPVGSRNYYVQAFKTGNPTGTKSDWGGPDSGTRVEVYVPPVVVEKPGTPSISLTYSGGPTWTGSWSATGATSYTWSFYTADNNSGTNMTYRSGGTGTSMSFSGGGQFWGKVYVTATNAGGSTNGESAWV